MSALLTLMITVGNLYAVHAVFNNCSWTRQNMEVKVNCSGRHLASIPPLNDSVTYLDLSHNEIERIKFDTTLENLKFLDISWNNIKRIDNSSFVSLRRLQFLDLSHSSIRDVDEGAFGEMTELKYLNISYNKELGFVSLPNITFNLNKTKLLSLNLNAINCRIGRGTIMKIRHLQNLKNTNITELYLTNNRMELLQPGVIYNLPKTIEVFSVAENKLTNGPYLQEFYTMSNVKILDMSLQRSLLIGETLPSSVVSFCREKIDNECRNVVSDRDFEYQKINFNFTILSPPNLESIFLHTTRLYGKNNSFSFHAGKLKHLYIQNNFIVYIGTIEAKDNTIETVDFSNNYCSRALRTEYGQHVKRFNYSNNDLGQDLEQDTKGEVFKSFINLEVLDISFNKITSLPRLLLRASNKLKYINVSNNRLTDWTVDITEMLYLTLLDLSENKLATINEHTRNNFANAFQRQNLKIDLSNNQIMCTCDNEKYLQWIVKFQKHFVDIQNYSCSTNTAEFDFQTLNASLDLLLKHCASYTGWYIGGAVAFAILCSFMLGLMLVKNKSGI